jgi:hypothetical protein
MSEPFVERLSGFTPDAGGLDRDALLFAAGRASVHRNPVGFALAGGLALTQVLTLTLLWPRTAPTVVHVPPPRPAMAPRTVDPPDSPGLWSVRHSLLDAEPEKRPAPDIVGTFIESESPLRAFAAPPTSILN